MFPVRRSTSQALAQCRSYCRTPTSSPKKEVFVSQSRDLARNIALEDWTVRNTDLSSKNILILTNNLSKSPLDTTVIDIKATLLCDDANDNAEAFERMVLSSLPTSLPLLSIPNIDRGRDLLLPGAMAHSVRMEIGQDVPAKTVLTALHNIAKTFLGEQELGKLSLVRPDNGWFPGIESLRIELDQAMGVSSKQMARRKREDARGTRGPLRGYGNGQDLQNSFGH